MEAGTIGTTRTAPHSARTTKILFAPVSGPRGVGEYRRSLFLAQDLRARHPDWEIRLIVAEDAPYVDDVPVPIFRTQLSPTLVPDEVEAILRDFRPDVVVFDCSGRRSSLRTAHALGARTVFVSNHAWKRWKGFRVSRLRYTDEHWILPPRLVGGDLTRMERLKLRWLRKPPPIFLGPVFPEPVRCRNTPHEPFFVCCPGGGGNDLHGTQSGGVFADTARVITEAARISGVLVTGENFRGELTRHPGLTVHRSLPGDELAGLLSAAEFAVIGGGDLLSQTVAIQVPAVSAPVAPDQYRRIRKYARAGLCIRARPERLARTALDAYSNGRLKSVGERLRASELRNGLGLACERIEDLVVG
jgi:hypothetical protein